MSYTNTEATLCWCCKKATGECSWSGELKPVEGWTAVPTFKRTYSGGYASYLVTECPLFEADACCCGLKRLE